MIVYEISQTTMVSEVSGITGKIKEVDSKQTNIKTLYFNIIPPLKTYRS